MAAASGKDHCKGKKLNLQNCFKLNMSTRLLGYKACRIG